MSRRVRRAAEGRGSGFFRWSVRPWGLLTAAGNAACAATVLGFLGRFSWAFDLFSHFRVQYLHALLALGILHALGRRRRAALGFLVFACVNLAVVFPWVAASRAGPGTAAPTLRAMLINVHSRNEDAARATAAIRAEDPDILVLEEINGRWMEDLAWLTASYPHSIVRPREDSFGIGLFSKFPLEYGGVFVSGEAGVPSIAALVSVARTSLLVVATHPLPPAGREYTRWRDDQLDRLPEHVRSPHPVLLLGDLNVTPWNARFRRLLARTGLRDSSRGFGFQPTWQCGNLFLRLPIDHCLYSEGLVLAGRRVGPDLSSDHRPLIVDFAFRAESARPAPDSQP